MEFKLDEVNEFITFVEKFQQSKDASISMLVKNISKNGETSLKLKTYSYPNPFQKKNFIDPQAWVKKPPEEFAYSDAILEQLRRAKKVSLVTR